MELAINLKLIVDYPDKQAYPLSKEINNSVLICLKTNNLKPNGEKR